MESQSTSDSPDDFLTRLEHVIFHRSGARRFTQDSPILPELWLSYGRLVAEGRPHHRLDLLLSPHQRADPGELCEWIRRRLVTSVEKKRRQQDNSQNPDRGSFELSYNDSHVVVRLSFEELIRVAIPLTRWWEEHVWNQRNDAVSTQAQAQALDLALLDQEEARKKLADHIDEAQVDSTIEQTLYSDDLIWLIQIAGLIADHANPMSGNVRESLRCVEGIWNLLKQVNLDKLPESPVLWLVSENRRATVSISDSVPTMKADAAQRLFDLCCSSLTWAVIDSGIDALHPAFRARIGKEDGAPEEVGQLVNERAFTIDRRRRRILNHTRVLRTYDFTRFRHLMNVAVDDDDEDKLVKKLLKDCGLSINQTQLKQTKELRRGLQAGRFVDWGALESILRVDRLQGQSKTYQHRIPKHEHGTHVAGILAGDWRRGDQDKEYEDSSPPASSFQGVCPDILLYDLQVLDADGKGDEFAVLAALQFVRYLNAGRETPVIHGVNVSLSILHDIANYACGRTPVCDECNRVVSSGVVVVAAAGNQGYAKEHSIQGSVGSYRDISITDPGNAEQVITVGATHRFKPHTYGVSYFSSRGPTGDGRSKPDLVAPGEKIEAPVPGGNVKRLDGTSMATPHVSGAAAMLMARHNELKGQPLRIKQVLCETATDLGRERDFQGHGMVDVLRAIQSL